METQINKSETFALHLATMITIFEALKDAKNQPPEIKAQVESLAIEALLNHPQPAEA